MKEQNNNFTHKIMIMYLSWLGAGRAKRAPGTIGTLASLPFIYAWSLLLPPLWMSATIISLMTFLACWWADIIQKKLQLQDPQWIVVDEVIGMAVTWTIVSPLNILEWGLCFLAFRFFDIVKIWPASFFDKKVKNGAGTILDDVISGIFAGNFVWAVSYFFLRN